ncbi:MAG: 1-acyl-sn-glycerol-3-phosphate acyltransferase [Bacteroidales bacterium]|nr:1-acyl-sn-glycerol-3-phosphate acyltransferase [Bacteroidales bacterium]
MISFKGIEKPNLLYKFLYWYGTPALRFICYRKLQVVGRENIPKDKKEGFLIICNHQNGLLDAFTIIHSLYPREPVLLSRGDIFMKDSTARLLRLLRMLPVFRVRDAGVENLDKNQDTFDLCIKLMQDGVSVCLFPEAGHQNHHYLGPFKKGFARMAFGYEQACDFTKDLKILPLGHHYLGYTAIQNDALFTIGEPFTFEELYDVYKEHPERGLHLLTQKARERVNSMVLNIEEKDNYQAVEQLCLMYVPVYEKKHHLRKSQIKNDLEARKAVNAKLKESDYGRESEPVAKLMADASKYLENLKKLKLEDGVVERANPFSFAARTLLWIVLLPVFAITTIINFLPHRIARSMANKMKDPMLRPTMKVGSGLILFLVWYLIIFAVVWIVFGKFWIALVTLLLLPATMWMYHTVRMLSHHLVSRIRKYWLKIHSDPTMNETQRLRRDIMSGLDLLMK